MSAATWWQYARWWKFSFPSANIHCRHKNCDKKDINLEEIIFFSPFFYLFSSLFCVISSFSLISLINIFFFCFSWWISEEVWENNFYSSDFRWVSSSFSLFPQHSDSFFAKIEKLSCGRASEWVKERKLFLLQFMIFLYLKKAGNVLWRGRKKEKREKISSESREMSIKITRMNFSPSEKKRTEKRKKWRAYGGKEEKKAKFV